MDSLTLIDKREQLKKKAEDLISTAEKELRKLNDKENDELNSIKKEQIWITRLRISKTETQKQIK